MATQQEVAPSGRSNEQEARHVAGSALRVGDTIEVWWGGRRDTITELRPYTGTYADNILKGARVATFALFRTGMTIEPDADYVVLARMGA